MEKSSIEHEVDELRQELAAAIQKGLLLPR